MQEIAIETKNKGLKVLISETPALLIAVSSLFSPKLPKVINEESNNARGNASGVILIEKYNKNSSNTVKLKSLPKISSKYFSINCNKRIKTIKKKVKKKGPINDFQSSLSNFFIYGIY